MEPQGIWSTIKKGFWLGIGFVIPLTAVMYAGAFLTMFALPSMVEDSFETNMMSEFDKTAQIKILDYREEMNGQRLLILGAVNNQGPDRVSSIRIEAELFDADDRFVYECSEYISRKLDAGESENFQIRCGCNDTQVPAHARINLRVVSANSY